MAMRAARCEASPASSAPSPSALTVRRGACSTSTSTYSWSATARVSKPGPRLAADAGARARTRSGYWRLGAERPRLLEPAVQGEGPGVAQNEDVLDGTPHAALLIGGDDHPAQQVVGLVAVVLLGVGVNLEVLDVQAVVIAQALVHHLGVAGGGGEPLPRPAEGGQPLLVGAPHVVQAGEDRPDRLRQRAVGQELLVRDAQLPRPLDLHVHVIAVAGETRLVGQVLQPVEVVLTGAEVERVGVRSVGHQ